MAEQDTDQRARYRRAESPAILRDAGLRRASPRRCLCGGKSGRIEHLEHKRSCGAKGDLPPARALRGSLRRVISLPEDVHPDKVDATYRDGIVQITVQRQESAKPRLIEVH